MELGVYKMSSFCVGALLGINENQYARKIRIHVFGPFPSGSDNDIAADDHDSQGFLSFDDALKVIEYKIP